MHPIARILGLHHARLGVLITHVEVDDALRDACSPFDYEFDGTSRFILPEFDAPVRDESWSLGVIVGPSGSGKTSILRQAYGITEPAQWNPHKAIASQVPPSRLAALGLSSVPVWCRPFQALSNGEAFRANIAKALESNTSFDEFSSTIDRTVAMACSHAISRFIKQEGLKGVVLASCHYDILGWLDPDWVFDTQTGCLALKGCLRRRNPFILHVFRCDSSAWRVFRDHHYLTGNMNKSAHCFMAVTDEGHPVAFASALAFPSGSLKNAWREHRTVVLPDYQGLGIGVRLSDFVARIYTQQGSRYFSKTSHPRMGGYRERSPLWVGTSKNRKARLDYTLNRKTKEDNYKMKHAKRVCFSHEFIGGPSAP
jgi:GNAT superfamily N-acetyltransferase/ABC-type branched-subunit amino acid transport system ATPase component